MAEKMLIDASHEEETRVVVVRGNRIEEFDFESQHKKQIRGNIYLAKVTRVEPSLQAAFVDYGGNRHGFLAFAEIHPDYYQIPLADRQALLKAEADEHRQHDDHHDDEPAVDLSKSEQPDIAMDIPVLATPTPAPSAPSDNAPADTPETLTDAPEEEAPAPKAKPKRVRKPRKKAADKAAEETAATDGEASAEAAAGEAGSNDDDGDDDAKGGSIAAMVDSDSVSEDVDNRRHHDDDDDNDRDEEKEEIESVGAEDAMEEVPDRVVRRQRKQYRIQEVIKRRQILLVQVAKEERGNKGAALTTYLSLAGRYSVLMPNTARGGGISRKITNPGDRKRLKEVARELEVPQGMGVILRTAGANRTKVEVKRDFEYLMRLWENVRTLTLNSTAPCLVYEEGSLIKRSIRDLYNKDITEVVVAGEAGYREAKDFMKMLMPSHAKVVQPYRDLHPIFSRSGIEGQLDKMLQPQVTLKSGGYIIINQTEALVAIDVNSGRSTREYSIEDTALQTNLEAAEEVARQLRLRDLAGLIVIDFIDMEEKRNNRSVEKKLKDCLKNDRARIQVGRISHFGLLEMSRQRIRASVLESTTQVCPHCTGTGLIRSQSSVALHVLRGVEEYLLKATTHDITVRATPEIALYLLNQKRATITDYEKRFGVTITIDSDASVGHQHFAIDRGEPVENPIRIENLMPVAFAPEEDDYADEVEEDIEDEEVEDAPVAAKAPEAGDDQNGRKRKRRRRRRNKNGQGPDANGDDQGGDEDDGDEASADADQDGNSDEASSDDNGEDDGQRRKRRRRGKRGGRRNRNGDEATTSSDDNEDGSEGDDAGDTEAALIEDIAETSVAQGTAMDEIEATEAPAAAEEKPARKPRRTRRAKGGEPSPVEEPVIEEAAKPVEAEVGEKAADLDDEDAKATPQAAAAPASAAPVAAEQVSEKAEAAPAEAEPAEAEANETSEDDKSVRANRGENISSSEPVVTSTANGDEKPKKGGWWQRRGFF
ncbi:Rne/Rng family ribonuclease [Rhizobium halophytocola]|uniref:Ribonuclease E n=1 Tax=Rhizobium halophytocola TaxID=735519 RepID=A0ABS4DXY6_9HYPH|nr:ribonuclease E/G [Rhizobium halophytocola]MBP1850556.1 ribonuclease E [Rhizobium halophytocola]